MLAYMHACVRHKTHVSSDNHATQLVYDQHVQRRGWLAELLLEDLQDGFHDLGRVPQSHSDVTQPSDGVVRNQMGLPVG